MRNKDFPLNLVNIAHNLFQCITIKIINNNNDMCINERENVALCHQQFFMFLYSEKAMAK
jgi:hypothetical protein